MKTPRLIFFSLLFMSGVFDAVTAKPLTSPDGKLEVEFTLTDSGEPRYVVRQDGAVILRESRLGIVRDDTDFTKGLKLVSETEIEPVKDSYEILNAKRRHNEYRANRKVIHLVADKERKIDIIFQVSNDGLAFRYCFPETSKEVRSLKEEASSFHFPVHAKAWLQPMSVAKTGYEGTNPAYEEYFSREIPVGTPSRLGAGWVYPALFRTGETWVLISEGSLGRSYCGTHLKHDSPDGEYGIAFADPRETMNNQPANPSSQLPWLTPWRIIVVGSLKTVAESTLGIDLAEPAAHSELSIKPGKCSWSWPLLGDASANYDAQKQFIDYAADMGWAYCLIDAWWDKQIGYEKTKDLADYARTKNVDLLLWYNSAGDWNTVKMTPRDKMVTHESRVKEFDRLKAMGIKGLKVDFFGGDGQPVINYYRDILEDAEPYGFLMNFHGTTLPRGWQRTYPHLMTAEAIKGFEYITFNQKNADEEPTHSAMLPFTRNVFDPMDFTPVCLDKINKKVQRRTTSAFELALAVIFTSGIQHYAEIPAGMAKAPGYVKDFMKAVPSIWEDTKFIQGYPGKLVVLARKGGNRWYLAGINGDTEAKPLKLDLSELSLSGSGSLITDGEAGNLSFRQEKVRLGPEKILEVTLQPHGGFVVTFE